MLQKFFQRVKIIIVVCLFVSVALPSVSHALEMKSEAHCQEIILSDDHVAPQAEDNNKSDAGLESDGCDCCHSGCCNFKAISKISILNSSFDMETIEFSIFSNFLTGTNSSSLFRPPKNLV